MRKFQLSILSLFLLLFGFQFIANAQVGTKITQTSIVEIKLNSVLHINCYGDKKGAINIMVSGGVPPYTYDWSNGASTQDIAGLAAGEYYVKVVDSYGCPDSLTVEIKEPEKLDISIDEVADILCFGYPNGGIDVTVSGGVPPYLYSWSDESSSEDLRSATAGEYALLVTDANHCQEITSANIKQNTLIVRSNEKVQNVECSGDSTGTIEIFVNGGVPPYNYFWTSGERTKDLNALNAGTYTVQVTDASGCVEAYATKVYEPKPILLKLKDVRHIACAGDLSGAISVNVKGGVKPYTYRWNDSLSFKQDLAGLNSGNYKLVVEDASNCIKTLEQEVREPEKLIVNIDQVKNVTNFNGTDGAIYLSISGGVVPYKYKWSNGPKNEDVANIPANSYSCRITDANKCVNTISVNVDQPALLEVEITHIEQIKCYGEQDGYIDIDVNGGVAPYSYSWSNGDTTKNIANLGAGNYNLTVTDTHGMIKTVKGIIDQPSLLDANLQSISNNNCFGDNLGTIDINIEGGIPPYVYNWNNGARTQDIAALSAGEYFVQIVDKNNCTDTISASVKHSPLLDVKSQEIVDISCFGTAEGSVKIDVTGGVSPYAFNWSNGSKTKDLVNIKAGQYNIKVVDSKGCNQSLDVRISEPPLLRTTIAEEINVKCKGESTGAVNLLVSGGTTPYLYEWSDGNTEKNNTDIGAGSYNVKITDSKACVNTLSATVTEPSELYSTLNKATNIDCFSENSGALDVAVGGGIPPYVYKWSNDATTQNLVDIAAGEFVLKVQDQNACESELKTTVVQNTKLGLEIENVIHVLCNGLETGSAIINATGGIEPYSFRWSNGSETKDLSNVKADKYKLIISDALLCNNTIEVTIEEPSVFEGTISDIIQIGCYGDSNGVVQTNFKGGVEPYDYLWSSGQSSKDIQTLIAGTYSLTAKDNNGCETTLDAVIEQPVMLELELITSSDNPCYGNRSGAVDISLKGGVPPYTYEWSNSAITQDLTDLEAGQYFVNVVDATGCQKYLSTEITQPTPLDLAVTTVTDIICFGENNGAIDISVSGGKEPYTYSWSNGAVSEDISEIVAGSYTLVVNDANGCVNSISTNVNQPEPLIASISDVKNINCFGDSTGAITIDVAGGTQPYQYTWSNGVVSEDIENLKAGDYSVEILDAKGCAQNLTTTITQPPLLIANIDETIDVLCNDFMEGSIDISVSGGVTPYLYTWSNGSKEQDVSNIGAGEYSVKIEDNKGCIRNLTAEIKEPAMMIVSISEIENIKEFGKSNGSISISISGGVAPYNHSWSNGEVSMNIDELIAGNYSVIVNDAHGCRQDLNASILQPDAIELNLDSIKHIRCFGEETGYASISATGGVGPYRYIWSNNYSGKVLDNVPAGEYTITITDANNTSKEKIITIEQPEYFNLKIDETVNPTCYKINNGMIKTDIRGGSTPYTFEWNTGDSTQNIKGLTSGKYNIMVTDANGCSQYDSTELIKPDPLDVILVNTDHIECYGEHKGGVDISVKGGTPPYNYNWNHGAKEQNLVNVRAGSYTLKVLDANKCIQTVITTVNEPPALVARFASIKDVSCQGESTGFVSTSVTGGMPPYDYLWNNGDSTASIEKLYIGNYDVVIRDSNGCVQTLATKITEPEKVTGLISNINDIDCFGAFEGSISIDVKGGISPYTYGWSNGSSEQNLTGIPAGDYSVKVVDGQGCEISLEASVNQPTELAATLEDIQDINCYGDKTGAINVSVSGGIEPYEYSWSNGHTTQDLINIPAGDYDLKVKDSRGCFTSTKANIMQPEPLVLKNTSITDIKCNGETDGDVTISITGGVTPYKYIWNNGAATRDIQDVPAGIYSLSVSDANECVKSISATITEPPKLISSIDAVTHISCNGESSGAVNISASKGISPYSYQWSNGSTSQDLLNVIAGDYSVVIRENNGCESNLSVSITEPTLFVSELVSVEHNQCYNDLKGSINISAAGGVTPYAFSWSNGIKTQNLKNVVANNYSVLVSDANGCNRTITAAIEEPTKLTLKIDSARMVKCCGDTSGAIFITVTGGVAPYDYLWSHGAKSQDITGLVEGQYTVNVTDANNCIVNTPEEGASIYEKVIAQGKLVSRDILFAVAKSTLEEKSFIEISRIASFMKEYPQLKFSIEGHTDSQGDATTNLKLSESRAEAIKESLVKFGISEKRLTTKGYGESTPIDSNATAVGRANNRRVEFVPISDNFMMPN
jgi:outer membrane protein OmpA-like peptidoglycan-associated protein